MSKIRKHLSYANVVASLALFLALGGVGYAAIKLPKNSVGTKQLKNGAVTGKKIAPATLKTLAAPGTQTPVVLPGPAGPRGATGPQGETGPPGEPGSARAYARVDESGTIDPAHSKGVLGVALPCTGGLGDCTAPPPAEPSIDFCFKLGFEPNTIEVTPEMGRSYAPDADTHVEAKAPGRGYSEIYGGCPTGYRDAEVRAWRGETQEPGFYGFYVVFN